MPNVFEDYERRLWEPLTSIRAVGGDRQHSVFLRPCQSDRARQRIKWRNLLFVGREDLAAECARQVVVGDLNTSVRTDPVPVLGRRTLGTRAVASSPTSLQMA
jgi:hypothetical protein